MNLKPARMDDIRMWNYGKLQQFVMEFSESDLEAAEIELQPNEYASVYSAQIALAKARAQGLTIAYVVLEQMILIQENMLNTLEGAQSHISSLNIGRRGEIGRHKGLKILRVFTHAGSSPAGGTSPAE